jgi:hypothetical protein
MALCRWMVESVPCPNYWEIISGIPPDSSTRRRGVLGLGNTSSQGSSKQVGVTLSRDTTGEGCKLFCNSCFNKQSVSTVTVTVTDSFLNTSYRKDRDCDREPFARHTKLRGTLQALNFAAPCRRGTPCPGHTLGLD